jgi:hypothetical protein
MPRTLHRSVGLAVAGTAALGLVASGAGAAISAPRSHAALASTPALHVTASRKGFTVKGPTTFAAGRVALTLKSTHGDHEVDVVSFKSGYSFSKFTADVAAYGQSAQTGKHVKAGLKHLRNAVKHTNVYGGLDATNANTSGTIVLPKAGTYTIFNDSGVPAQPTTLTVTGPEVTRADPGATATAIATNAKRWAGSSTLPAKGTITFENKASDTPHFLVLTHVKKGTTRKQIITYLNSPAGQSNAQPPFALKGEADTDILGAHQSMTLTYKLPKGTYAELCFFPDLKTGMPHALMGMVRIVTLK